MSHSDRDDADLLARARQGDASAFAVLLHRYGPAVHAALSDPSAGDPPRGADDAGAVTAAVTRTFLQAMRQLEHADDQNVCRWLLRLALEEEPGPDVLAHAKEPEPLPAAVLDQAWADLAARWPTGRRPLRAPRWVGRVALLLLLLTLAAGVPYVVLVTASDGEYAPPPISEVLAEPLDDVDDGASAEATDTNTASPNDGDLPDDLDQE